MTDQPADAGATANTDATTAQRAELETLAYWAKEARLLLIVAWSYLYKEREMPARDKQVCAYISEMVKRIEDGTPPLPPPTSEEMDETRRVIVAALDQRRMSITSPTLQTVPSDGVKASKTFAAARARLGNPDE
jgi:hypothetical protein